MNRHAAFVQAVSAGAVVHTIAVHLRESGFGPRYERKNDRDVIDLVARACQIDEAAIPRDVSGAARQFVLYAIGEESEPEWYETWRDSAGVDW